MEKMFICSKCKAPLNDDGLCILCGKGKNTREAEPGDIVYVASSEQIFAQIIEDCLDEIGVSFVRKGDQGSAVTALMGNSSEIYRYYVALSDYKKACEALTGLPMPLSDSELEELALGCEEEN